MCKVLQAYLHALAAVSCRLEAEGATGVIADQGFPHALHQLSKDLALCSCDGIGCVQHKGILCRHHLHATDPHNIRCAFVSVFEHPSHPGRGVLDCSQTRSVVIGDSNQRLMLSHEPLQPLGFPERGNSGEMHIPGAIRDSYSLPAAGGQP